MSLEIVGDSSSLERAFANASNAARKFNQQVGTSTRRLGTTQLKQQADAVRGITKAEEELIKVRSRRASSLGPFRLAGVGIGAGVGLFAATQAVRELGAGLETTGEAAFKAEGRIKNMVAALTSGSLVGAVRALTRVPKELEDLGITAATFIPKDRLEALKEVAKGTAGTYRDLEAAQHMSREEIEKGIAVTKLARTADAELAKKIIAVVDAQNLAQNVTRGMEDAQRKFNRVIWDGTSALVEYKRAADDLAGPRGPGARAFETPLRPKGLPTLPPLSPSQRRELDLIGKEGMEQIPLLQDRLRQLNNQMRDFHGNQQQRLTILTRIKTTEEQIAGIYADQAEKRRQAAEAAKRAAEAAAAEAARRRQEARAAELARELRILEGPIPTRANLLKQFAAIQRSAAADKDFPNKLLERFAGVARLLREEITPETREAINAFFETVRGEFDKGADIADPLARLMQVSTRKMVALLSAGTNLTAAGRRTLGFNIAGAQLQPLYIGVNVDGREIGRATTQDQTRTGRRTSQQTSGRRN